MSNNNAPCYYDLMLRPNNPRFSRLIHSGYGEQGGCLGTLPLKCCLQAINRFIFSVQMDQIVSTIHPFEIGEGLLVLIHKNYLFALPHTLSELILSRIARLSGFNYVKANLGSRLLCSENQQWFLNLLARK